MTPALLAFLAACRHYYELPPRSTQTLNDTITRGRAHGAMWLAWQALVASGELDLPPPEAPAGFEPPPPRDDPKQTELRLSSA